MSLIDTRRSFEEWAAAHDMDLKPGRCTMGEYQYSSCDTDFAWESWKFQQHRIAELEGELNEAQKDVARLDWLERATIAGKLEVISRQPETGLEFVLLACGRDTKVVPLRAAIDDAARKHSTSD